MKLKVSPSIVIVLIAVVSLACTFSSPASAPPRTSYRYDNLPDASGTSSTIAEYKAISAWDKTNITYFFANGTAKISGSRERELVGAAFDLWASETPLIFTEADSAQNADILIRWGSGEHGDGDPFDGPGDVLAHASYPNPYTERQVFLHFDDDERWLDSESDDVDLLTVAAHEIGHTLGFDHSNDPDALMYPRYSGPHRRLGQDDVAGAHSVYGTQAQAPVVPQTPSPKATKSVASDQDSDGDGLSDSGETLITGTDPKNPDTDADGLGDGVEVVNSMNPLDADMDKDGVNDGDEISAGTNPFLPDQSNGVSGDLADEISAFLTKAIKLEIQAYRAGDASITASVFGPSVLANMEEAIAEFNQKGLMQIAKFDEYKSYMADIRVISQTHLEVDTCEVWTQQLYYKKNNKLAQTDGPNLVPQTITLEQIGNKWLITDINFFDAPAFCKE